MHFTFTQLNWLIVIWSWWSTEHLHHLYAKSETLVSLLCLPYYSTAHISLCCSKANNPKAFAPQTGVSYHIISPMWVFAASTKRKLDIKKFEKPLNLQPPHSHTADLITQSGWNDILKEAELWQVALCHHYSSDTHTLTALLCCSQQLCTYMH